MKGIEKKNFDEMRKFVDDASVDTRAKIKSLGDIPPERQAKNVTFRMPQDIDTWLSERVKGNRSLAITAILDHGIKEIEKELQTKGTFNVKKWLKQEF